MQKLLLYLSFIILPVTGNAQGIHLPDSLIFNLEHASSDSLKKIYIGSLYQYYYPINRDSANYFGSRMIELAKATDDTQLLYDVYGYLGTQSRNEGNYLAALEWHSKTLELAREKNDSIKAASTLNAIGNLYKDQKLFKKAITYYHDCKRVSEGNQDSLTMQNLLFANMNLGFVFEQMDKIDSALLYEQNAYALALSQNDRESLGFILCCLGNIHFKLNNKPLALDYYKLGISQLPREGRYSCMLYNAMGNFFRSSHQDSAAFYAGKSLAVATAISNVKYMADAAKLLSEIFVEKNNKDSAFFYQNMYLQLYDSLNNRERIAQFENLDFKEALHQQEKQEALKKAMEKRHYNIQLVILTLAILGLLMLFLLISRSIIVSHKLVAFLSIVVLLVLFEFINLLVHPILEALTHDKPVPMLLALVTIAALIVPLHHRLEKWTSHKLVEKNKAIRLANAKKVIKELENNAGSENGDITI